MSNKYNLILFLALLINFSSAGKILQYTQICTEDYTCYYSTDKCCNASKKDRTTVKLCAP